MNSTPTILALFFDQDDHAAWSPLLEALPARIRLMIGRELPAILHSLATLSPQPVLAVVSAKIYPNPTVDLVRQLRQVSPDMDTVVLASAQEHQLPVRPLMNDKVRHLAVTDPSREPDQAYAALCSLLSGKPWELETYLKPGSLVIEVTNVSPSGKEAALQRIEALLDSRAEDQDMLRQRAVLLADEMLENAFLVSGAETGEKSRGPEGETAITLRAGFDGESMALQVVDRQGRLFPEDALAFLAQHQDGTVPLDQPHGRGLFIIWRFLDHFHVNIKPGLETVIGGQLRRSSAAVTDRPKGFHFFIQPPFRLNHSLT